MSRLLALVLGTILWVPAIADGNFQIHLRSKHANGCESCNERHLGLGWTGPGRVAPTVGYYPNSYNDDSFYGGVHAEILWGFSTSLVGITGYTGHIDHDFLFGELVVAPLVHYRLDTKISPLLTYVPNENGGVALISINYRY